SGVSVDALEHGPYAAVPWSIEHSTVVALASTVKPNTGMASFVGPDGPESIDTDGAAQARAAIARTTPSASTAATMARQWTVQLRSACRIEGKVSDRAQGERSGPANFSAAWWPKPAQKPARRSAAPADLREDVELR